MTDPVVQHDDGGGGSVVAGLPPARLVEAERVRAWRAERFEALIRPHGWGPTPELDARSQAERLADARGDDGMPVDLHAFERLVGAGCDVDIAEKLLVAL